MMNIETTIKLTEETRDIVSDYLHRIQKRQAKRYAEKTSLKKERKVYDFKTGRFL